MTDAEIVSISRAMAEIVDAIDEQSIEIELWRRTLKNLTFECTDLKVSLIQYEQSLGKTQAKTTRLGTVVRDTARIVA